MLPADTTRFMKHKILQKMVVTIVAEQSLDVQLHTLSPMTDYTKFLASV